MTRRWPHHYISTIFSWYFRCYISTFVNKKINNLLGWSVVNYICINPRYFLISLVVHQKPCILTTIYSYCTATRTGSKARSTYRHVLLVPCTIEPRYHGTHVPASRTDGSRAYLNQTFKLIKKYNECSNEKLR